MKNHKETEDIFVTRDELIKHFSKPMYDHVREDIYRIMLDRPDISDPGRIEDAAEQMHESRGDGVELTVENAMRLTENEEVVAPWLTDEETKDLGTKDGIIDAILNAQLEDYSGCAPSKKAERKFRALNAQADILAGNKDIVITGRPEFFPGADWARLAIAVFCPTLTKDEQTILSNMKNWSDGVSINTNRGYPRLIFYINNIWDV